MTNWPTFIRTEDLAPGDTRPHPDLPTDLKLVPVTDPESSEFELGFRLLNNYFGSAGEMESRDVIAGRLNLKPEKPVNGHHMLYQLMLLYSGNECVGLRDHTAILRDDFSDVVVHLSHVLVVPKWRRKGLSAILRTLPVITAHECAQRAGKPEAPITLFCEMEPLDLSIPANKIRRISYEKAGFKAIGSTLNYIQPDFRDPQTIDADPEGSKPIPFDFLLRRVGRESDNTVAAREVISNVELIYAMYAESFRDKDMEPCFTWLSDFCSRNTLTYPLYRPTEAP
ncbi:MAG: hypothetical protein JW739_06525 [Opitutales bacterium]|nr:hypothetical protein [Opitutales bacterium]